MIDTFQANSNGSMKHSVEENNTPLSPVAVPAQKQLKYSAGIANSPSKGSNTFNNKPLKVPLLSPSLFPYISIILSLNAKKQLCL